MSKAPIDCIYFDMGWTLRHTVKDPIRRRYWLEKIIQMTGLAWTPDEMAERFTERALAYKKWGESSLVELNPKELWLQWLLPELQPEFVLENAIEMNRYWRRAIGEGKLFPHTVEVISALFERGYRLGIISNTVSSEETPNLLKKYEIDRYFEVIILSCNFGKRKPGSAIFHTATEQMGVDPARCAYVGDQMDRDIVGSKQAGFPLSILVRHAPQSKEVPGDYAVQPDHIIDSLTHLLDIFPHRVQKSASLPDPKQWCKENHFWNVSLSTMWSFENKVSLPDILPVLEKLELSGIEINHKITSADLMGYDLSTLPIDSLHEPCPADVSTRELSTKDWLISATDEEKRQQGVRMVMRTIDLAHTLGVGHIVVHPGNAGLSDQDEKNLRQLYVDGKKETEAYRSLKQDMLDRRASVIESRMNSVVLSLQELLAYADGKHMRLALENRYHFMDIPSPAEMETLLRLAGPDRLGFQLDIGHAQTMHVLGFYPFMEWIHRFADRTIGLHIHDVRGVTDHFAPGLGEVDYQQFIGMIPNDAQRTLEVHGANSLQDISKSLLLLSQLGLIHRF
jgi:HAD superfamily hydrolase (TIGR01549 family)